MTDTILIVDSGATKADWRLVRAHDGSHIAKVLTQGMNVSAMSLDVILDIISAAEKELSQYPRPNRIHFYTAGIITDTVSAALSKALGRIGGDESMELETDLIGTCRAVCEHQAGIAAILGTGSAAVLFDGEKIIRKVNSGGFILGDQGSAATLGRLFLSDLIKDRVPGSIADELAQQEDISYPAIVDKVYHSQGSPSGYLGSFAPFILSHYDDSYIKSLVDSNFQSFIDCSLKPLGAERYPVGIVGGFAYACREILDGIARASGISISKYVKEPVSGLIEYHCNDRG